MQKEMTRLGTGMFSRRRRTRFVYECPRCHKKFRRVEYNPRLNKHKDKNGNRCICTVATLIERKY